jgi:GrpB-like predicted nucleotidyltransferase (UPF0157 family)
MPSGFVCADSGHNEEPIEIVPYDRTWLARFENEKGAIKAALCDVAIEVHHIGSTAVRGLAAKPIIDILVAVESFDSRPAFESALHSLGYVDVPHSDDARRLFFKKGVPRAYHVHVVKLNGQVYREHILFRDILASDPSVRAEYERLKMNLASRFRDDRVAYTDAKNEFIQRSIEKKALLH